MNPAIFVCPACGTKKEEFGARPDEIIVPGRKAKLVWELLCKKFGFFVTKEEMLDYVWGNNIDGPPLLYKNTLSVYIHRIRGILKATSFELAWQRECGYKLCYKGSRVYNINILDENGRIRHLDLIERDILDAAIGMSKTKAEAARKLGMGRATLFARLAESRHRSKKHITHRRHVRERITHQVKDAAE